MAQYFQPFKIEMCTKSIREANIFGFDKVWFYYITLSVCIDIFMHRLQDWVKWGVCVLVWFFSLSLLFYFF